MDRNSWLTEWNPINRELYYNQVSSISSDRVAYNADIDCVLIRAPECQMQKSKEESGLFPQVKAFNFCYTIINNNEVGRSPTFDNTISQLC